MIWLLSAGAALIATALVGGFGSGIQQAAQFVTTSVGPFSLTTEMAQNLIGSVTGAIQTGFTSLFEALPDGGTLPQYAHSGAIYFGQTLDLIDFIFPTHHLISIMLLILTIKLVLFSFYIVKMVFNFVRGIPTWNTL